MACEINKTPSIKEWEDILKLSRLQKPKDLSLIFENACNYLQAILKMQSSLSKDARIVECLNAIAEEGSNLGEELIGFLKEPQIKTICSALEGFEDNKNLFKTNRFSYLRAFLPEEGRSSPDLENKSTESEGRQSPQPRSCRLFSFFS